MPIDATEELELVAKRRWQSLLHARHVDPEESLAFAQFYAAVGFIRKYKSYGVKFATPFGYSIFDLYQGCGFSVQLHRTAKVEAFHILAVRPGGFVVLCRQDEWEEHGAEFTRDWERGAPTASPLTFSPARGDVFLVDELELVHSVIGCTLEEFATTSNDAVARLFDQNADRPAPVPNEHSSLRLVLETCGEVAPSRRVWRDGGGWVSDSISDGTSPIIDLPEDGLRGGHLEIQRDRPVELVTADGLITTLACVAGAARAQLRAGALDLPLAGTVSLAPGQRVELDAVSPTARVAVCSVDIELAFGDFRGDGAGGTGDGAGEP